MPFPSLILSKNSTKAFTLEDVGLQFFLLKSSVTPLPFEVLRLCPSGPPQCVVFFGGFPEYRAGFVFSSVGMPCLILEFAFILQPCLPSCSDDLTVYLLGVRNVFCSFFPHANRRYRPSLSPFLLPDPLRAVSMLPVHFCTRVAHALARAADAIVQTFPPGSHLIWAPFPSSGIHCYPFT